MVIHGTPAAYDAQLRVSLGEYHFVTRDAETSGGTERCWQVSTHCWRSCFVDCYRPRLLPFRPLRVQYLGLSKANLLTSLLFAGAHLFVQSPLWAAAVIVPSLIFGAFRDRYKSVDPAIILHSFYNLGYFLIF